jgi:hypothetical protein
MMTMPSYRPAAIRGSGSSDIPSPAGTVYHHHHQPSSTVGDRLPVQINQEGRWPTTLPEQAP